jgi:thiol-disulfide isomerase/thioredoxin
VNSLLLFALIAGLGTQPTVKMGKPVGEPVPNPFVDDTAHAHFAVADDLLRAYTDALLDIENFRFDEARPALETLLAQGEASVAAGDPQPWLEEVVLLHAVCLANRGDPEDARSVLEDWRARWPDSRLAVHAILVEADLTYSIAETLERVDGEPPDDAVTLYEQVLDLIEPVIAERTDLPYDHGIALYVRGGTLRRLDDIPASVEALETLVETWPRHHLTTPALYALAGHAWVGEDLPAARTWFGTIAAAADEGSRWHSRSIRALRAIDSVGRVTPEFEVGRWYQGETTMQALRGSVVLVVYWGVWCHHCFPAVEYALELQAQFADQGLQIVLMTKHVKNQDDEAVLASLAERGWTMPAALEVDPYTNYTYFGIDGIPAAVLIDREGTVVWRNHPKRLTAARLSEVL